MMSLDVWLMGIPTEPQVLFSANITHNLGEMAEEAGIYDCLWHPENINAVYAKDIIEPLKKGIELMKLDPKRFIKFEPENGWGTYDNFMPWLEKYLEACIENPDSKIKVDR
jgi:hypothetical protein